MAADVAVAETGLAAAVTMPDAQSDGGTAPSGEERVESRYEAVALQEFITGPQMRALLFVLYTASVVSLVMLWVLFALEQRLSNGKLAFSRGLKIFNVVWASITLTVTLVLMCVKAYRRIDIARRGLQLSLRRRNSMLLNSLTLGAALFLQVWYLVPNAYLLHSPCSFFAPWGVPLISVAIEWTAWNAILALFILDAHWRMPYTRPTQGPSWAARMTLTPRLKNPKRVDHGVIDIGWDWRILGTKLLAFAGFECFFLATWALYNTTTGVDHWHAACVTAIGSPDPRKTFNQLAPTACHNNRLTKGFVVATVVCLLGYLVAFIWLCAAAWVELAKLPYRNHRIANQRLRLLIVTALWPLAIIELTMVLLWLTRWDSCDASALFWPGMAPAHNQLSAYLVIQTVMGLPFPRMHSDLVMRSSLQQFAWLEADVCAAVEARRASDGPSAACQPVFCVETSLIALWFASLAYEDAEGDAHVEKRHMADVMALCQLQSSVAFHQRDTALHVVVAWSDRRIIVAFRGTAERANVVHDLQVCLSSTGTDWMSDSPTPGTLATSEECPRRRGRLRLGVHRGFSHTWRHGGMNRRIVGFIHDLKLRIHRETGHMPCVLLCGHSLGGALATLCAFDLRNVCGDRTLPPSRLAVYTFGSPRVGNRAFARFYDAHVCCNHWNIINGHDAVVQGGKFALYKHVGRKAFVNPRGDLIVRPGFEEATFLTWFLSERVAHHFISAYRLSMYAVAKQYDVTAARISALFEAAGLPPLTEAKAVLDGVPAGPEEYSQAESRQARRQFGGFFSRLLARFVGPGTQLGS